ncbi:MAG: flagella basal body P-ring formation protein FlgA [Bdellovibrionaceae bacterium]|nr:flagella basal body P-ring formation protein FlgA [Pseudobdellovibrionaceae bacterium]|tara:strand:- start:4309 stop:4980 length:672 start_codon:yes stop_codon:yes gene_type:complete
MNLKGHIILIISFLIGAGSVFAKEFDSQEILKKELISVLSQKYRSAEIKLTSDVKSEKSLPLKGEVILMKDQSGIASFRVGIDLVYVAYQATIDAWVANRRIHPKEILKENDFRREKINVAHGLNSKFKDLIVRTSRSIEGLEAKQSILSGNYVLLNGIQKKSDISRGEKIKVILRSGNLSVTTDGVAQESGFIGKKIRVMSDATKKNLLGKIESLGLVEVSL